MLSTARKRAHDEGNDATSDDDSEITTVEHTALSDALTPEDEQLARIPQIAARFEIDQKLGEGAFSIVYAASLRSSPAVKVALKKLYSNSSPQRIANEINCLAKLTNHESVCRLLGAVRHEGDTILVLEYFPHDHFHDYFERLTLDDTRAYMRGLFSAMEHIHALGIIHRDIKPRNFLFNPTTHQCKLVDFGLSECRPATSKHHPSLTAASKSSTAGGLAASHSHSHATGTTSAKPILHTVGLAGVLRHDTRPKARFVRAGTRGFRAVEVLLQSQHQTTAIDVWCAGVILLMIAARRYPLFDSTDDMNGLCELACVFGTRELIAVAAKLNKTLSFHDHRPAVQLNDLCDLLAPTRVQDWACSDDMLSLMNHCLALDPHDRITAEDALKLPFFE